jgi:hypothetical protein
MRSRSIRKEHLGLLHCTVRTGGLEFPSSGAWFSLSSEMTISVRLTSIRRTGRIGSKVPAERLDNEASILAAGTRATEPASCGRPLDRCRGDKVAVPRRVTGSAEAEESSRVTCPPCLISRPESNEPKRIHRGHTPENRHPPLEVESEKGEMAEQEVHGRVSPLFFLKRTYPLYFTTAGTTSRLASLAWISQTYRCIGAENLRKLLCCNNFSQVQEHPDADATVGSDARTKRRHAALCVCRLDARP